MKKQTALFAFIFLALLLSACNNPIVIPANVAVTLPANQDFIISATVPVTPVGTMTPASSATATLTPVPSITPSQTPSRTPLPTRKSPYPAAAGTAIIDSGFQPISLENVPQLGEVYSELAADPYQTTLSGDGQKLFLGTSNGLFLFNRQGQTLAHWKNIFTVATPCESCMSANHDGTRVAIMARHAGTWEAQIYDVQGDQAKLALALPAGTSFIGAANEASIAISPDDTYLAFKAGAGTLRVLSLETKLQVLGYDRAVTGITFTPDGANFVIHGGQELLFYNVNRWKQPANFLLPREDTPYAFSPNGKTLAIALATKLRVYTLEKLQMTREINVPPSNADTRVWQIAFVDDKTLAGYATRQEAAHTSTTVESGEWDVESGKTLRFDTSASDAPDALAGLWGTALALPTTNANLEAGVTDYNAFRFVSDGVLLVNSPHSACLFKLLSGENTCFKDQDHIVFATDGSTFKEVLNTQNTNLVNLNGIATFTMAPYRVAAVNRSGEWALLNNGFGTDLYTKSKNLPQESVKGVFQGFAENGKQIVFTALEKENSFTIYVIDKTIGKEIHRKKDNFLYKPILMTNDGSIYYIQNELEHNQTVLNMIDPKSQETIEVTRLSLPATPGAMALSNNGLFAIGQEDGAVLVMTKDGGQTATFQAATSSIAGLAFSPDGRFLAVVSAEGLRVYALIPTTK